MTNKNKPKYKYSSVDVASNLVGKTIEQVSAYSQPTLSQQQAPNNTYVNVRREQLQKEKQKMYNTGFIDSTHSGGDAIANIQNSKSSFALKTPHYVEKRVVVDPRQATGEVSPPELIGQTDSTVTPTQVDHDWKKRYDDSRTYINKLQDELKALRQTVTTSQPEEVVDTTASTDIDKAKLELEKITSELERARQELNTTVQENKTKAIFKEILRMHPDAEEIKDSAEWKDWYFEQPQIVQDMVASEDATAISKAISLYKAEKGINTQYRSGKSVEDSMAVQTKTAPVVPSGAPIWSEKRVQALTQSEYKKYRDEIMEARRSGRYTYD